MEESFYHVSSEKEFDSSVKVSILRVVLKYVYFLYTPEIVSIGRRINRDMAFFSRNLSLSIWLCA